MFVQWISYFAVAWWQHPHEKAITEFKISVNPLRWWKHKALDAMCGINFYNLFTYLHKMNFTGK